MLAQLRREGDSSLIGTALRYLERTQEADGSWYGRWGMNYIYGTWSVLNALGAARVDSRSPVVRRAVEWLVQCQNPDGGWGEDARSYDHNGYEASPSTASQTAWALLGLMAVGEERHPAVGGGITYLLESQASDGFWLEERYTATGFPRVFYLRYHGYSKYFPLWALARFRNLTRRTRSGIALNGI
jgi:squalene-hopene/tetraprenyl-beta-curcumene cyclase